MQIKFNGDECDKQEWMLLLKKLKGRCQNGN